MNMVEKTGKTVEDAVKAALAELGVGRDQAEVEVLEESKPSLLGLFGGRDAKVRVTVKEAEPEAPAAPEAAEAPVEKTEAAPQEDAKAPEDGKRNGRRQQRQPRPSWKKSSGPWAWICSSKNSSAGRMRKSS